MKKILAAALTVAMLAAGAAMAEPSDPWMDGPQDTRTEQRQNDDRQERPSEDRQADRRQDRQADNRQNNSFENRQTETRQNSSFMDRQANDRQQGQQPPEKPSDDRQDAQTPPEKPSDDRQDALTPPEKPSDDRQNSQQPGDMGQGQMPGMPGNMGEPKMIDFDALVSDGVITQETGDSIRAFMDSDRPSGDRMPERMSNGQPLSVLDKLLYAGVITAQEYEAISAAQEAADAQQDGQQPPEKPVEAQQIPESNTRPQRRIKQLCQILQKYYQKDYKGRMANKTPR